MVKKQPSVIAVGKHKGHIVTKFKAAGKARKSARPVTRKGHLGKRVRLIREVISEVAGVASYEKRMFELLKGGSLQDSKKALKIAKKTLGTHQRGKLKREAIMNVLRQKKK